MPSSVENRTRRSRTEKKDSGPVGAVAPSVLVEVLTEFS
jgi:hypothetical protein